jgi:hypothetical protein
MQTGAGIVLFTLSFVFTGKHGVKRQLGQILCCDASRLRRFSGIRKIPLDTLSKILYFYY